MLYRNEEDGEASKLARLISEKGYEATFQEISGLEKGDPLLTVVMKKVELLK